MFSHTFSMLFWQFGTSLIFSESCFAFLSKLYINQGLRPTTLLKKRQNTFFTEHLRTTTSADSQKKVQATQYGFDNNIWRNFLDKI